jgi:hypothetical protein
MRWSKWAAVVFFVLLVWVWAAVATAQICLVDDQGISFRLDTNSGNGGFGGVWKDPACPHQGTLVGSLQTIGDTVYFGWTGYHVPDATCNPKEYHGVWSGAEGTGTWFLHSQSRIDLIPCTGGAYGSGNSGVALDRRACLTLGGIPGTPVSVLTGAVAATGSFRMNLASCPIPE